MCCFCTISAATWGTCLNRVINAFAVALDVFRFIAEEKSGWRTVMKRIFVGYGLSNWTGCWRAGIEVGLSRNCIFSKIVLFHAIINTWCIHFRRWKTWQVLRYDFFFIIEKSNWKMWLIRVFLFWFFVIKLIFFFFTYCMFSLLKINYSILSLKILKVINSFKLTFDYYKLTHVCSSAIKSKNSLW